MNDILNKHRLARWAARILQRLRDGFALATAVRQVFQAAQPPAVQPHAAHGSGGAALGLLRPAVKRTLNQAHGPRFPGIASPQELPLRPTYVQLSALRPIWPLHNRERAREHNPLTSANADRTIMARMELRFHPKGARPQAGLPSAPVSGRPEFLAAIARV